jgi:MoaA/NifB/PqqE/SkfB family radical SAM enzyme
MSISSNYDFSEAFERVGTERFAPALPSPDLLPNLELGQAFVSPYPDLWRVEVLLGTHDRLNRSTLFFLLREGGPAGRIVAMTKIPGRRIENNAWHSLEFEPIAGSAGKTYCLSACAPDAGEGNAFVWWMDRDAPAGEGRALFNGTEGEHALCIRTFHLTSPEIWRNLQKLKAQYREPVSDLPFTPVRIVLELTSRCNLRCRMCRDWEDYERRHKSDGDLADDLFEGVLDFVPGAALIQPQGWGEPLLHARFFDYMARIREVNPRGIISFNTNGVLLGPEAAEKIVALDIDRICVSLDSARKDVFKAIRGGASLDKILDNVSGLRRIRENRGKAAPLLTTHMVLMAENVAELPDFFRMCRARGIEEISLGTLYGCDALRVPDFSKHTARYLEARDYAYEHGLKIYGTGVDKFESLLKDPEADGRPHPDPSFRFPLCSDPWETVFYEYAGNVRPCCNYLGLPVYGNAGKDPIGEIWNTADYQKLRTDFLSGSPIPHCRDCIENLFAAGRSIILSQRHFPMRNDRIDQKNPCGLAPFSLLKQRVQAAARRFKNRDESA